MARGIEIVQEDARYWQADVLQVRVLDVRETGPVDREDIAAVGSVTSVRHGKILWLWESRWIHGHRTVRREEGVMIGSAIEGSKASVGREETTVTGTRAGHGTMYERGCRVGRNIRGRRGGRKGKRHERWIAENRAKIGVLHQCQ